MAELRNILTYAIDKTENGAYDEVVALFQDLAKDAEFKANEKVQKLGMGLLAAIETYQASGKVGHKRAITRKRNDLADAVKRLPKAGKKVKGRKKANPCLCGCGELVAGKFKQGHDQRTKGMLIRNIKENGGLKLSDLPKVLQSSAEELATRWGIEYHDVLD